MRSYKIKDLVDTDKVIELHECDDQTSCCYCEDCDYGSHCHGDCDLHDIPCEGCLDAHLDDKEQENNILEAKGYK